MFLIFKGNFPPILFRPYNGQLNNGEIKGNFAPPEAFRIRAKPLFWKTDPMTQSSHPVEDVLDTTDQLLEDGKDGLQVSELMDELGVKSIAAVLLAPSLALVSPLSGIPLFSSACGITIALISAQMLMGRNYLWLPSFLSNRSLPARNTQKATRTLRSLAAWMDRRFKRRLQSLLTPPFLRVLQGICLLCGLIMPFLEVLPFTSSILGGVVALLALSMLTGDGLIALVTVTGLTLAIGGAAIHLF